MTVPETVVLVADDDSVSRLMAQKILKSSGFDVHLAQDGGEAIDKAEHLLPAVILLDWVMPVLDGPDVCRRLKENPNLFNSQIVVISSRGELDDKVSALESGADDYLVKPYDPKELIARVRSALRIYELKRQLADKAERQALLRRAAERIHRSLNIEEILDNTVKEVRPVTKASRAVIFGINEETRQVYVLAEATCPNVPSIAEIILEPKEATFSLQVIETGLSAQIPDVTGIDEVEPRWFEESQLRSLVAVPIKVGEKIEAGLALHQCDGPRAWTAEEIAFLETLAVQTGIALEHAWLYEKAQAQAQREALIKRTIERIRGSLKLEEIFQATVDELRDVTKASRCVIFERSQLDGFIIRSESAATDEWSLTTLPGSSLTGRVLGAGVLDDEPLVRISDLTPQTGDLAIPSAKQPRALLALPLKSRGNVVAGLALHQCDRVRIWTAEEVDLISSIADQTGLAIENAQLFSEIREKNRTLEETVGKLEELARQREEFTAVLVHDIRSPLSVVLGALEIVETKARMAKLLDSNLSELMASGKETVSGIVNLVNEMLDFAKVEAKGMTLNLVRCPAGDVIKTAIDQVQLLATKNRIDLHFAAEPGLPTLTVDFQKITRALTNLLTNAIKFTPSGGEVIVQARETIGRELEEGKRFVTISVIDTGPGIHASDLPYIFNPYYQAKKKSRQLGTGLGLAIVQRIAASHGGNVSVQSTENVGTSFSIILPIEE